MKDFRAEDLIPQEETIITMSADGYIKRLAPNTFKVQKRGGSGIIGSDVEGEDVLTHFIRAKTHDNILFFTDKGVVFQTKVYEIPVGSRISKGKSIQNFLEIPADSKVNAVVSYEIQISKNKGKSDEAPKDQEASLAIVTKGGVIKKTNLADFANVRRTGIIAIKLRAGDQLKWVKIVKPKDEIIICTSDGRSIHFKESDARAMGRTASGVRAINLRKGDEVSSFDIVEQNAGGMLLVVMANGFAKQTSIKEYKVQRRGGSGIATAKITDKTGALVSSHIITNETELIAISKKGQIIRTEIKSIRETGRSAQGVRIMRLKPADKVAATVCLSKAEDKS